ncbi:hypothetical protein FI667_g10075, partial [Globisporangium splendens]
MTTSASSSTASVGDASDDESCDPVSNEDESSRVAATVPYTSLQVRGRVIEQEREGLQRRSLLQKSLSPRRGSTETTTDNQPHDAVDKRMLKRSAKSFRMGFVLNAGNDGLDELVNNISSEGHDRGTLFVQATLALWEYRRKAAALRRWKEILQVGSDSFQLFEDLNVNDEARKILYSMEATRIAMENAALVVASPRPGSSNSKHEMSAVSAAKLSRRDLDLLVIWARQMQPKAFPHGVDDTSIREAMKFLRFRQYEDGDALFFEGEIGELFYFLFQGTVAVYVGASTSHLKAVHGTRRNEARRQIDGQKPDLTQLGKRVFAYRTGEGFGETAMFTNDAIRTASAIAVGTCEVCEMTKEVYRRTLKKYYQQFFEQGQKINFMQRVPLFKDWQRVRLSSVADVLEKRKLAFGDKLLIEASSVLHCCYFVLSGLVKITKHIDLAPPPFNEDTAHQSTRKKPRHRIQTNIELQTCGSTGIVALEALMEPNSRATYTAVAASANVELYVLKETDARSFLGSSQPSLFQRVREICRHERLDRQSRLDAVRHTFHEHETLKKDAELLQSQDHFAEDEDREQSVHDALAAKAEAALRATNAGASPLLCATAAAPYLPHLRASKLLAFGRNQTYVPMNPATRVDLETMAAISSPKMLSTCAKNFIFENSDTLTSEYPDRLRLHFLLHPRQVDLLPSD